MAYQNWYKVDFAKQIILKELSMATVSIYNDNVYRSITLAQDRYVNVNKLIDDLIDCIELYSESLAENNVSEANLCVFMYQNYMERLSNVVITVKEKADKQ